MQPKKKRKRIKDKPTLVYSQKPKTDEKDQDKKENPSESA